MLAACVAAAKNHGILPANTDSGILKQLRSLGVVHVVASPGQAKSAVLSHDVVRFGVCCSQPVLEHTTRTQSTALELQLYLRTRGWTLVNRAADASITAKRCISDNSLSYYEVLKHFHSTAEGYEQLGNFHHRQSDGYYKCIQQAITCQPDPSEDEGPCYFVPISKSAAFYDGLLRFFAGR